jgi:hypothetical protein
MAGLDLTSSVTHHVTNKSTKQHVNGQLIDFINHPDRVLGAQINFTLTKSTSVRGKASNLTGEGGAWSTKKIVCTHNSTLTKITILILFYYLNICMLCTKKRLIYLINILIGVMIRGDVKGKLQP